MSNERKQREVGRLLDGERLLLKLWGLEVELPVLGPGSFRNLPDLGLGRVLLRSTRATPW